MQAKRSKSSITIKPNSLAFRITAPLNYNPESSRGFHELRSVINHNRQIWDLLSTQKENRQKDREFRGTDNFISYLKSNNYLLEDNKVFKSRLSSLKLVQNKSIRVIRLVNKERKESLNSDFPTKLVIPERASLLRTEEGDFGSRYSLEFRLVEFTRPVSARELLAGCTIQTVQGYLTYFFGGLNSSIRKDFFSVNSHGKLAWLPLEVAPGFSAERYGHSMHYKSGKIYVVGGFFKEQRGDSKLRGDFAFRNFFFCIELLNLKVSWSNAESEVVPSVRKHHGSAMFGTQLIVVGGELTSGEYSSEVWLYSLNSSKWVLTYVFCPSDYLDKGISRLTLAQEPSADPSFLLFGGLNEELEITAAEVRQLRLTNERANIRSLQTFGYAPPKRHSHSFTFLPSINAYAVFGGKGEHSEPLRDLFILKYSIMTWCSVELPPQVQQRYNHVAECTNEGLIIFGGVGQQSFANVSLLYLDISQTTD